MAHGSGSLLGPPASLGCTFITNTLLRPPLGVVMSMEVSIAGAFGSWPLATASLSNSIMSTKSFHWYKHCLTLGLYFLF
jgi:hypothetical protein